MRCMGFAWRSSRIGVAVFVFAALFKFSAGAPLSARAGDSPARPLPAELATAIRNGDVPLVAKFLDGGVDVNARDAQGNTPLILASFYAGPGCVELLLNRGADVDAVNQFGASALVRAATSYEKSRLLLKAGADVAVRTADLGNTPLILAARKAGNSRTVKLLLEKGADVNETNNTGVTPLLAAAASGDLETAKLLLEQGADPNAFPEFKTPHDPLASGSRTALMWAAYHNDLPMMKLLLEHGADPNQKIAFGTALSHAGWHNSVEAAELLLARGAGVDSRDPIANFTPLHWAASSDSPSAALVTLLLEKGADPNAAGGDPVGAFVAVPQTPRLLAEKRGRTAIVEALVAAGAKEPHRDKAVSPGRTAAPRFDEPALIDAAERALAALQATAAKSRDSFLRHASKQDCTSCHQQYLPMAAVGYSRDRSVRFDREAAEKQQALFDGVKDLFFHQEYLAETVFHPEPAYALGYEMFGLLAEKVSASAATDVRIHQLATIQAADGRWFSNLPRPPMQSSDVGATALAIHAIQGYGWPGRQDEFSTSVDRGRRWLWNVRAETTEDAVFQLLGLHWAGEPADSLQPLAQTLLEKQHDDGGWAQLPKLDSDAYATGEVLFALAQSANVPVGDPAWQRGLQFLLKTQQDDGTWHVARRAFPFQPTMDSGFPYHRDSWISAAATSWAVIAISRALPHGTAIGKPEFVANVPPADVATTRQRVDFARQIKPLLERSCIACHSGEMPRGSLRLDTRDAMLQGGESGTAAVVPGQSEKSLLVEYVSGRATDSEMPPLAVRDKFPGLTDSEVALLRAWVDQGAEWPANVTLSPRTRREK